MGVAGITLDAAAPPVAEPRPDKKKRKKENINHTYHVWKTFSVQTSYLKYHSLIPLPELQVGELLGILG